VDGGLFLFGSVLLWEGLFVLWQHEGVTKIMGIMKSLGLAVLFLSLLQLGCSEYPTMSICRMTSE
jgi:hypothetical protein